MLNTGMNASQPIPWKFITTTLVKFAPLWVGVTLFCGALGFAYSIVKQDLWEATQPLIVREEASGSEVRLGRFSSQTELQAAQETILEMARNREVVEHALTELGPYSSLTLGKWPTSQVVDSVAGSWINVRAPETSEFGKTEVVYLATKAESPQRAEKFCGILFNALSEHMREVRRLRADSIIEELRHARSLAQANLDESNLALTKLESSVGMDLGELRGLSESLSGDGGSSRIRSELEKDIRTAELELKKLESLHNLLIRSEQDTTHLLVSDAELLQSQPTLQRLKTGLIDAQLEASKLAGRVTDSHPRMLAAVRSQNTIRGELRDEISNVIRTMGPSMKLAQRKLDTLHVRQRELEDKLGSLANIRADYSQLIAEVKNRTEILNQSQTGLAEAEALRSAAINTNLLAAMGPPKSSEYPVGLGTTKLTAGAMVAGLLFALGTVFLVAPNPNGQGFSRRLSDTMVGRREVDRVASQSLTNPDTRGPTSDRRATNRLTGSPNNHINGDLPGQPQTNLIGNSGSNSSTALQAQYSPPPTQTPAVATTQSARPQPFLDHSALREEALKSGKVAETIIWSGDSSVVETGSSNFRSAKAAVEEDAAESADQNAMLNQEIIDDLKRAAQKNNISPN